MTLPNAIYLSGQPRGFRYEVVIDDVAVPLTLKCMVYFAKMGLARIVQEAGWVYKYDLEPGENHARYVYRLKQEVALITPLPGWPVVENNGIGYYRLAARPGSITANYAGLLEIPDAALISQILTTRDKEAKNAALPK